MTDEKLSPGDAAAAFWKHMGDSNTVMLGINDPDQHTQPMTAFAEPDVNMIWFFTRDDLDLATEAKAGKDARMIMMSNDRKVFADIRGTLDTGRDRARIERYWGPMVAAWYPEGKDDPHLMLLRFVPEDGQVWVSTKGLVRLTFEVIKANVTGTMPKAGGVTDVNFKGTSRV
jgi:general stress protein 26